jgi:hypothetical protein
MRFCFALILLGTLLLLPHPVAADQANETALEARVKALEQRIAELEARLNVVAARQAPPPPGVPGIAAAQGVATGPVVASAPARWKDSENWGAIRQGMGWSQVKALLGVAGKVTTGVFGDVWYYPDDSGGRVVFDRDGRVAEFNVPQGR